MAPGRNSAYRNYFLIRVSSFFCEVVCREFGDQRSAAALREAVYCRHQQVQESVRDYGHALQRLHERLVAKHGQPEALPAAQVRDHLIEGLLPGPLRRHLRRRAAEDAAMTFRATRDEALRFERDEAEDAPAVARVCEQREQTAADLDDRVAALTDDLDDRVAALTDDLDDRVAALTDDLDDRVAALTDDLDDRVAALTDDLDDRVAALTDAVAKLAELTKTLQ